MSVSLRSPAPARPETGYHTGQGGRPARAGPSDGRASRISLGEAARGLDLVWLSLHAAAGGNQSLVLPFVKRFAVIERRATHDLCSFYCLDKLGHHNLLPAAFHDLTPLHELAVVLPPGALLFGDKAYNSEADEASILAETEVRLIPARRANMQPHEWFLDQIELREYRHTIESVNSQCEKMGLERLYARINGGFELKVLASIIALAYTNLN